MLVAVLPGTFDPPTNGHLNLIFRASKIFDTLHVVIADNAMKETLFTGDERYEMMKTLVAECTNVEVHVWNRLIVEFVRQVDAKVLVRGVRALADFGYEFELAMTNKSIDSGIETIFIPTDPKYFVLRSSAIKEIALLGGNIGKMVPKIVADALRPHIKVSRNSGDA